MKTAMQEFLERSIKIREINPSQDVMPTKYYQETLLQTEKEQIINAYNAILFADSDNLMSGEEYYNKIYDK